VARSLRSGMLRLWEPPAVLQRRIQDDCANDRCSRTCDCRRLQQHTPSKCANVDSDVDHARESDGGDEWVDGHGRRASWCDRHGSERHDCGNRRVRSPVPRRGQSRKLVDGTAGRQVRIRWPDAALEQWRSLPDGRPDRSATPPVGLPRPGLLRPDRLSEALTRGAVVLLGRRGTFLDAGVGGQPRPRVCRRASESWQTGVVPSEHGESLVGVSETALGAAEMRSEESLRPDPLVDDPYAAAFVAAAPPLFPDLPSIVDDPALAALKDEFVTGIAIRTRFYDDYLFTACAAGCRQVVLLAAGLDTRAFRLNWPVDLRFFEVDLPELFVFKEKVLAQQNATPRCSRTVVGIDLRDDWSARLIAGGFDPNVSSAWTAEGLLAYLSNDDAARLLANVGELSTTGSRLSFDYDEFADDSTLSKLRATPGMREVASMWEGGLSENPVEWMRAHGWRVSTSDRAAFATRYGRPLADATGGFLEATRL
jgi:methyltransferase (TIGR00027 family)